MTSQDFNNRIRKLNESTVFQMIGRFAGVFAAVVLAPTSVWGLTVLLAMSNDIAVMKSQIASALADPYKGADAKRDFDRRDDAIRFATGSIDDLKSRVGTLEYASANRHTGQPRP